MSASPSDSVWAAATGGAPAPAANGVRVPSSYEMVEGWGMAVQAPSRVLRPRSVEEIEGALAVARADGVSLGLRGSGCSYGDASVNAEGHVLDLTGVNRILDFDAETGMAELEPGVTIEQLWKHILPQGYWPKVVSGTMFPTVAGAAAMNIHGKNNYKVGTFGDAIDEFDLLLPDGGTRTCSRTQNSDLFHAAIGGFGMLGVFTRLKLRTTRVHSGDVEQIAFSNRSLAEMMEYIERRKGEADYLVGWIDCFGKNEELGRGLVHEARYLRPDEDPDPQRSFALDHQELPANILGVFPKSEVWRILALFASNPGMRLVNGTKYWAGKLEQLQKPARLSHAGFNFLLDYVPNWKWSYGRGGLIQYQSFLPADTAYEAYSEMLRLCHKRGLIPWLGVFKRHRPDPFWMTHAVDGWSFAMDFHVSKAKRERLWKHCAELTEIVLEAGGKFYFAKDLVIGHADMLRFFPSESREAFLAMKSELDPEGLLQTNLWRRVFAPAG